MAEPAELAEPQEVDIEQQLTTASQESVQEPSGSPAVPQEGQQPSTAAADPSAPAAPSLPGWRQVANELNFQIPEGQDEQALFKQVFQGYSRGQQAQQQLQQVIPYWSEFQQWRASQAQQKPAQQPALQAQDEKKPWWSQYHNPPPFDPKWRTQITKDLDGNLIPSPGAAPDVVSKYLAYENYRQDMADKLTANPYEFIQDPVKHLAREEAKAVFAELQAQQQEKQFIQTTISDPSMQWVHQRDQQGNVAVDFAGRPLVTQHGQTYIGAVEELVQANVPVHLQHKYALAAVQAEYAKSPEYAASLMQQKQQPAAKQDPNAAFHQKHERTPNMSAILPGPAQGVTPPVTGQYTDARDLFAKALNDYTDKDIENYIHRRAG